MKSAERFFADFYAEQVIETMRRTVTETDLVNYVQLAGLYEEIWMDAARSEQIGLGGRAVPGGLSFSICEGLLVLTGWMSNAVGMLGVDSLKWSRPVRCGDTVRGRTVVTSTRQTSRVSRGLVHLSHELLNQSDEVVLTYESARLIATGVDDS